MKIYLPLSVEEITAIKENLQFLLTHNKNYTKVQYNALDNINEIIERSTIHMSDEEPEISSLKSGIYIFKGE